jgi:predicted CXXCH cytochrome family protein
MKRKTRGACFIDIAVVATMLCSPVSLVQAQSDTRTSNESPTWKVKDCKTCHQNSGMQPAYVGSGGLYHDLYIDQARFELSTHYQAGKHECADCHEKGYDVYPHQPHEPLGCFDCHADLVKKFLAIEENSQQSIHFRSKKVAFQCTACHSAHYMRKAEKMELEEKNAMCIRCHAERYNRSGLTLVQQHQWHPLSELHLKHTACIACHTQPVEGEQALAFKHRILPKAEASRNCDDCHTAGGKLADYLIDIGENPTHLTNEQLANHFYISGSTRVPWLDTASLFLLATTGIGVLGHGLARIAAALRRKS